MAYIWQQGKLEMSIDDFRPCLYDLPPAQRQRAVRVLWVSRGRILRGIAQPGSAPALGAGCRGFKSLYPDHPSLSASAVSIAPVAQLDRAFAF